jgi:hypothetical protein
MRDLYEHDEYGRPVLKNGEHVRHAHYDAYVAALNELQTNPAYAHFGPREKHSAAMNQALAVSYRQQQTTKPDVQTSRNRLHQQRNGANRGGSAVTSTSTPAKKPTNSGNIEARMLELAAANGLDPSEKWS